MPTSSRLRPLLVLVALATALAAFAPAPTSDDEALGPELDPTRVFPDPLIKGDFIQYTPDPVTGRSEYQDGLAELADLYPDVIEVADICELACDDLTAAELQQLEDNGWLVRDGEGEPAQVTSFGGREIPVVTVTDETYEEVPVDERIDLYFSMSIHGNERAGLEGSLRFIEDLAVNWTEEQAGTAEHVMTNGDPDREFYTEVTTTEALRRARIVFVDLNPDGWADGDRFGGMGLYKRGNDDGIDLNRQWPTLGWHNDSGARYHTMSQPEAIAGKALIEGELGVPEGAADLHGELHDNVLLAMMFPAGQFDPGQLAGQVELAEAIKYDVNHSVHPGAAGLLTDVVDSPVYPAEYHTAYDAIGYDDSGFQGDYLVQQGILELDHEYAFSNLVPSSVFIPELEQVHVDTTRELLEATLVTTITAYTDEGITYTAELDDRRVGYVHNPEVLTEQGATQDPPFELPQEPYESTSMRYYEDLAPYLDAGSELVRLGSDAVAAGDALADLDTVVVTDRGLPRYEDADGALRAPDATAFWGNLRTFAEAGGTVVLTDAALQGLASMGLVAPEAVVRETDEAGRLLDFDRSHPLLTDVTGIVGQTYFEVPLGYPFDGDAAPIWGVETAEWGGTVAASTNGGRVGLGTVPLGDGRVTIFGAVLPTPTQEYPHTHGLADYAVSYAGNAILVNALAGR